MVSDMTQENFKKLSIGANVKEVREDLPPIKGVLLSKTRTSAIIRTGYIPGGRPILRWVSYQNLTVI